MLPCNSKGKLSLSNSVLLTLESSEWKEMTHKPKRHKICLVIVKGEIYGTIILTSICWNDQKCLYREGDPCFLLYRNC